MTTHTTYNKTGFKWLPEVPGHWELIKTKYLFRLVTEQAPINNNMELLSVYTEIGVKPRKELEEKGNKASTTDFYWLVKKGDIIVNKLLAWMGAIGLSELDGVTSPAYDVLRSRLILNPSYYNYMFRCGILLTEFKKRSKGIMDMRLRLYFDELGQIILPYPPISEQNSIVKYLDVQTEKINLFISKKQKLIELLKEQKQAVINRAVTKGIDKKAKLKKSCVAWLGEIPENWGLQKLKFVANVIFSNVDKLSFENEIPVELCNYVDVYKNNYIDNSISFMKATAVQSEIDKFKLEIGDILVTKDSETPDDIAVPAMVTETKENLICGYHLAQLKTTKKIISEYLFRLFQSDEVNAHFTTSANGVTRYGIGVGAFKNVFLPIPQIKEQQQIITFIKTETNKIDLAINRIEKEIELIKEYKLSVIAEVVTGKRKIENKENTL